MYKEYINRTDRAVYWKDTVSPNTTLATVPAKTIMFLKTTDHILKNAINITWA